MTVEQADQLIGIAEAIRLLATGLLALACVALGDRLIVLFRGVSKRNNWFRAAGD